MKFRSFRQTCYWIALAALGAVNLPACAPVAADGVGQPSDALAAVSIAASGTTLQPDKTPSTNAPLLPDPSTTNPAAGSNGVPQATSTTNSAISGDDPAQAALRAVTGVGLWPHTYDLAGMRDALARTAAVSDVGMLQVPLTWDDLRGDPTHQGYRDQYDYLVVPGWDDHRNLFDHYGLAKAVWLDFLVSADRRLLNLPTLSGTAAFTNPQVATAYVADCVWLADYFDPAYLALGTEIDEYLQNATPIERAALLDAYLSARTQIKARHPDVVVFVYFQYENVVARDLWDVIRPFIAHSDLAAFSTYPSLPTPGRALTAANLPPEYYAAIADEFPIGPPPAFVELGHPAAPCGLFAAGSPAEQDAFLTHFAQIAPRDTALVVWSHLYDPDYSATCAPDVAQYFGAMGLLRRTDAALPPAWSTWSRLLTIRP